MRVPRRVFRRSLLCLVCVVFLVWGVVTILNAFSTAPKGLGVEAGQLAPCPSSPNCVCSQAQNELHGIQPIPFTGTVPAAIDAIREVLSLNPRVTIKRVEGGYLHAEARSRVFRFVDDLEFYVDTQQGVIHFRSASRVGYSDLGVNRSRMNAIRDELLRLLASGIDPS